MRKEQGAALGDGSGLMPMIQTRFYYSTTGERRQIMTRSTIYSTIDGSLYRHIHAKPGPKPLPKELLRPCRVFGSVPEETRKRLDEEIAYGVFKESDILNQALRLWFEKLDNIQTTVE